MTHICVSKITTIGSDNGLLPGRRQAIIWTSVGILLIGPLGTNFSEILIKIYIFSFKKMHLKMSFAKWRPFCLGLNVLTSLLCWGTFHWLHGKVQCFPIFQYPNQKFFFFSVLLTVKFKDFTVVWNAIDVVYLHSETASSKFYRAVGTKLGLAKGKIILQNYSCI